ncbi:serine/threonine-protein kinase [Nocardioides aromaticivorans]|nr:serine/threonine-protein kinase [Nocardioides aromaticivorans]
MADAGPAVVGGYELVGRVGTGSTATVWKARDPGLGRDVALKQVPAAAVEGLRAEAARLAQLDDPHVVQVFGFVEEAGAAYLVVEWIDGATLAEVLAAGGRLSVPQALGVVRGALLGLAHAHARGIVHGDVSASNVLVDVAGTSRLIDFGVGGSTPAYRAPEAARGETLSPAADVYAAAAVLVHLLTGQLDPGAAPAVDRADSGLRPVLATALAPEPEARYPDAAAFLAALEEAAERTYGPAWWTTAGVGGMVAPVVAAVAPLGGGAAGGITAATVLSPVAPSLASGLGAAAVTTSRRAPTKLLAGVGALVLLGAAGATAIAVTNGDDEKSAGGAGSSPTKEAFAPVVDAVPSGEYTFRAVVTKTDDKTWLKVGDEITRIWTLTPTCDEDACTGSITSTSGSEFESAWDGATLQQRTPAGDSTWVGDCQDDDGTKTGKVTVRQQQTPRDVTLTPTGPVDEDSGLPAELTGSYQFSETIIKYAAISGPSRPRDCPWEGNQKVTHTATYEVTLTRGADPEVVKSEEERVQQEKKQAEQQETP